MVAGDDALRLLGRLDRLHGPRRGRSAARCSTAAASPALDELDRRAAARPARLPRRGARCRRRRVVPAGLLNRLVGPGVQRGLVPQGARAPPRPVAVDHRRSSTRSTWSRDWNRVYGPAGFLQCQFVVPFGAEDDAAPRRRGAQRGGCTSFLAVLKRFGAGATRAAVVPDARAGRWRSTSRPTCPGSARLLDGLDDVVARRRRPALPGQGQPHAARAAPPMYPRLDEWRAVRRRVDPDGSLQSDLGRRLGLV